MCWPLYKNRIVLLKSSEEYLWLICCCSHTTETGFLRPNKKKNTPVFRVTQPYLNLLVKPRIFSGFLKKNNIVLSSLEGKMPSKMHKIIFFFSEKQKKTCVPTLPEIFRPVTRNTLIFFYLALLHGSYIYRR